MSKTLTAADANMIGIAQKILQDRGVYGMYSDGFIQVASPVLAGLIVTEGVQPTFKRNGHDHNIWEVMVECGGARLMAVFKHADLSSIGYQDPLALTPSATPVRITEEVTASAP